MSGDYIMDMPTTALTPARCIIYRALQFAQNDQAIEVVMGVATTSEETPIRYVVDGYWYEMVPFPPAIRSDVVTELTQLVKQGVLRVISEGVQHDWSVKFAGQKEECVFVCIKDKVETVS